MTHDQYQLLQEIDASTGGALETFLNGEGIPEYTVCPECHVDDFCHEEGCRMDRGWV